MLPLIYTNTTATLFFGVACLTWLIPETIGMFRQFARVSRKTSTIQDRGSLGTLIGLQWIGLALNFLLAFLLPAASISPQQTTLLQLGVSCIFLGVGLRWYAIRTLGTYFTRDVAVSADQEVIQRGPYRFIRHPAYSGTFLTMLGIGLALGNWAGLASLLICVFIGHFYRVRIEEQALIQAIGKPYIDYMRRTQRFIPLLF